jgi:hypothetical protein
MKKYVRWHTCSKKTLKKWIKYFECASDIFMGYENWDALIQLCMNLKAGDPVYNPYAYSNNQGGHSPAGAWQEIQTIDFIYSPIIKYKWKKSVKKKGKRIKLSDDTLFYLGPSKHLYVAKIEIQTTEGEYLYWFWHFELNKTHNLKKGADWLCFNRCAGLKDDTVDLPSHRDEIGERRI